MTLVIKCTPHLQLSIHDLKLKYCKICFLLFRVEWSVLRMTAAIVKGLHRVPLEHVPPLSLFSLSLLKVLWRLYTILNLMLLLLQDKFPFDSPFLLELFIQF